MQKRWNMETLFEFEHERIPGNVMKLVSRRSPWMDLIDPEDLK